MTPTVNRIQLIEVTAKGKRMPAVEYEIPSDILVQRVHAAYAEGYAEVYVDGMLVVA